MKTLLISPPRTMEIIGNNPALIDEERGTNPPLGILYIAAHMEKHTDHEVRVLDSQVERLSYEGMAKKVAEFSPDIVGITTITLCMLDVVRTIMTVKSVLPKALIVLGGPHANLYPHETINLDYVDFLVLGEGEIVFSELVTAIEEKRPLKGLKGIVYKEDGHVVNTGAGELIADLDNIAHPARHLVPYKDYTSILYPYNPATTSFTSRGCPYKCTFCDRPHLGKRFRARSAENVVDEMMRCKDMGIRFILVYDDTFTVDRLRVKEICELLIKQKTNIHWDIRARVDNITKDMLGLLKGAGCTGIHYGVESGSEKVLEALDKRISLSEAEIVFRETRRAGIKTLAYFMIGCPEETIADIETTFRVARMLKPNYVHMTVLTPFPGTKIYERALKEGIIKTDVWRGFAENPMPGFVPPVWGERFSRDELMDMLEKGYRDFYGRPLYILKRILDVRTVSQFKRFMRAGLKTLKKGDATRRGLQGKGKG